MTFPHQAVPPPRRWSSVRFLLVSMFLIATLYAGALPVYLFSRIRVAASGLMQGTKTVVPVLDDLARRADIVDGTLRAAERAVAHRTTSGPGLLDGINQITGNRAPSMEAGRFPAGLAALSHAVARSDSQLSDIAAGLKTAAALIAGRRWSEAAERLRLVDSLDSEADRQGRFVTSLARQNLLAYQHDLAAVTAGALRDTLLWLVFGLMLLWAGLFAVRRRILEPLSALEAGLARVSDGDLTTQVPVHRSDELGRLAAHFNEMTQVLFGRAEEQGRFTAAGQLLADVAHEVGNPLMAIAAHAEARIGDVTVSPTEREEMQQILRQAQRATKLLRGLVRFVRPTQRQVSSLNLNDVVRGALDIVSYRFGVDEITMGGELDPALPPVQGDAIALEQVVVNLLSNAIDALRTIKPPRRLTVDSWVLNGNVSIGVSDNGPGVAPEVLDRLFRPFASTKGRRGTGLGLYVSRQIVREAGGDLVLDTAPAGGARFVATLPAASGARPTPPPAPLAVGVTPPLRRLAGVRILLVDDEDAVRRPMAKFLTRRGAEVHEAGDGLQALALLEHQAVDVILADLRMPRMSGTDLFAALQKSRPELAVRLLFLSGDVSQLAEPGSTPVPRERVLVKPVELAELERRITEFVTVSRPA